VIERGDNWWHLSLATSPLDGNLYLKTPVGDIVDNNRLSMFAVSQEEKDFLVAYPPSTLGTSFFDIPAEGFNSANRLLCLSPYHPNCNDLTVCSRRVSARWHQALLVSHYRATEPQLRAVPTRGKPYYDSDWH
jgi:hypothetical protein